MRAADATQVRTLPLFAEMMETHFAALMHAAFLQRFPPHVILIHEGDQPDFLHVVLDGAVDLFASHEGRETSILIVRPIQAFILAAVMGDQPYLKSARTLEPSRILMIPAEVVRSVFPHDPAFAWAVIDELANAYRTITKELKGQKLRTSVERLANWVVRARAGSGGDIEIPYEKRTLASYLGMTPENLSRALALLGEHGVVVKGRTITVTDEAALRLYAKPTPLIDDLPT